VDDFDSIPNLNIESGAPHGRDGEQRHLMPTPYHLPSKLVGAKECPSAPGDIVVQEEQAHGTNAIGATGC
jgi:hypothetical protein